MITWATRTTDRQTDRQTDARTDGRTDGPAKRMMDGLTARRSLKKKNTIVADKVQITELAGTVYGYGRGYTRVQQQCPAVSTTSQGRRSRVGLEVGAEFPLLAYKS